MLLFYFLRSSWEAKGQTPTSDTVPVHYLFLRPKDQWPTSGKANPDATKRNVLSEVIGGDKWQRYPEVWALSGSEPTTLKGSVVLEQSAALVHVLCLVQVILVPSRRTPWSNVLKEHGENDRRGFRLREDPLNSMEIPLSENLDYRDGPLLELNNSKDASIYTHPYICI